MQFNSWLFLFVFLPIVLLGYYGLKRFASNKYADYYLIMCDLFFYGYAGIDYLVYFVICIFINYILAKALLNVEKKSILILGLGLNIGLLGVLKYYNFFLASINSVFVQIII